MSLQEVNESYRSLIDLLGTLDPEVAFSLANSIWCRENSDVRPEFIDLNKTYFDATIQEVDFTDNATVDLINGWISDKTNNFITKMLEPPLNPDLYMMLINAIYFKGSWTYQFDKENTTERDFFLADGSVIKCDMMRAETNFSFYQSDDLLAISLPYGKGDYSMTIILPSFHNNLNSLVTSFNSEIWSSVLAGLTTIEKELIMPKFELLYEKSLVEMLSAMGMEIAFSNMADFTNIRQTGGLIISDVKHKARIRVDEEGTEAAAVTVVEIIDTSVPIPYTVNHPFLFLIHENNSGTILFMGKVLDPTAG